jgi:hypothetical protein
MGVIRKAAIVLATVAGLATLGMSAAPAWGATHVRIDDNFSSLDSFQALNAIDTREAHKEGNDVIAFGENLLPAPLTGPEGNAKVFAQQASTEVTPSSHAFPTRPLNGMGISGRARAEATKTTNPAPGVPVADAGGSWSSEFTVIDPEPYQFAGSLLAVNDDADSCSEVTVELTGPVNRSFSAFRGADCDHPGPHQRGFVEAGTLPAGEYELEVEYEAGVDPDNPSHKVAQAFVDVTLQFLPPNTKVTRVKIKARKGRATFGFKAVGKSKGFECALVRGHDDPQFAKCSPPKTFRHLNPGSYTFEVRAIGLAAPDATPAKRHFHIG